MNEPLKPPLKSHESLEPHESFEPPVLPIPPALLELIESLKPPESRESPEPLELLTIPEAAAILRLKASTLRAWILRRKIEFCRVGRCVRIPRPALENFVRRNTVARSKS